MRFDLALNLRLFAGSIPNCGLGSISTPQRGDLSPEMDSTSVSVVSVPPNGTVVLDTAAFDGIVLIAISTDRKVTINVDGEAVVVDRPSGMAAGYLILTTDSAGPISLDNDGSVAAKVTVMLAGRL